jgi:hypothetical protein
MQYVNAGLLKLIQNNLEIGREKRQAYDQGLEKAHTLPRWKQKAALLALAFKGDGAGELNYAATNAAHGIRQLASKSWLADDAGRKKIRDEARMLFKMLGAEQKDQVRKDLLSHVGSGKSDYYKQFMESITAQNVMPLRQKQFLQTQTTLHVHTVKQATPNS